MRVLQDPLLGPECRAMFEEGDVDDRLLMFLFLIVECVRKNSSWKPYPDMLPTTFGNPLWCTDDELLELEGTTLCRATELEVDCEFNTSNEALELMHGTEHFMSNLSLLLRWSPYSTEADFLKQEPTELIIMNARDAHQFLYNNATAHGAKVIIYSLWSNVELDFDTDPKDIRISGDTKKVNATPQWKTVNEEHIANHFHYPLRGQVIMTIGFLKEAPRVCIHSFNVYHKNRLILACLLGVLFCNNSKTEKIHKGRESKSDREIYSKVLGIGIGISLAVRGLNDKFIQKLEGEKQHALTQMKMLPHLVVSSLNDMRDVLKVKKANEWEGNKISVNYDPNSDEYAQISKIAVDNELEVVPFDHEVEMDLNRNAGSGYGHPEWKR